MLVAITIIPTLCARLDFGRRGVQTDEYGNETSGRWSRAAMAAVRWLVNGAVRRVLVIAATVGVSLWVFSGLTPPA